jgi:hypothetical protein
MSSPYFIQSVTREISRYALDPDVISDVTTSPTNSCPLPASAPFLSYLIWTKRNELSRNDKTPWTALAFMTLRRKCRVRIPIIYNRPSRRGRSLNDKWLPAFAQVCTHTHTHTQSVVTNQNSRKYMRHRLISEISCRNQLPRTRWNVALRLL